MNPCLHTPSKFSTSTCLSNVTRILIYTLWSNNVLIFTVKFWYFTCRGVNKMTFDSKLICFSHILYQVLLTYHAPLTRQVMVTFLRPDHTAPSLSIHHVHVKTGGFNVVEMNSHFHTVSTPLLCHYTYKTAIAVCWTCWRPQYCLLNSTHTQFLEHYSRIVQNNSSRTMHVKLCLLNCTSTYRLHTCKICAERM